MEHDPETYVDYKIKKLKRAVLVTNLHPGTTQETLFNYFNQFGPTQEVVLQHCGCEYIREAVLLMRNESDALRIIGLGTHEVSDLTTAAKTLSYLGNEKRNLEKGHFKLSVDIKLLLSQPDDPRRERMGRILCDRVWTTFNQFSMTPLRFYTGGENQEYQSRFTVRFASDEDKEEIIKALIEHPELVILSWNWIDTRGFKEAKKAMFE